MSETRGSLAPLLSGLGDPQRQRLANGVELVSLPLPEAPLVCIDFWCQAGSCFERPQEHGMAHFLEHMVFKGSDDLAAGEFDRRVEALGGMTNAATGFDDVHFHVLIPPNAAAEALDLLLDLVLRPRLEAEAFTMERQVVLEELAQSEDQPEEVALQRLLAAACPGHPYSLPILGDRESLLHHDPEAMAAFHQRLYRPGGCVLSLAGAIADGQLATRAALGPLGALTNGDPSDTSQPPPLHVVPGEHRLALPRLEAARLLMAWVQPPATNLQALIGSDLATTVLSEGRRSRLVDRLREDLQLVESIDLDLHAMQGGSLALLEAVCEPEDLEAVRQVITEVWQEVMAAPIGMEEWERAQRLVANSYRFGLESAAGVAGLIGSNQLWQRDNRLASPLEMLQRWTPETLQQQVLSGFDPALASVLEAVPA